MVSKLAIPKQTKIKWGFGTPATQAPSLKHWILKGCRRCRGDMYLDIDNAWHCLQCGYCPSDEKTKARYRLGRKPLPITVKNISDTLQTTKSIGASALKLHCSRGYIYQELKKKGLTPKEVINKGGISK